MAGEYCLEDVSVTYLECNTLVSFKLLVRVSGSKSKSLRPNTNRRSKWAGGIDDLFGLTRGGKPGRASMSRLCIDSCDVCDQY